MARTWVYGTVVLLGLALVGYVAYTAPGRSQWPAQRATTRLEEDDLDDVYGNHPSVMRDCEDDEGFTKHTLKTAYELTMVSLFKDTLGESKFEASSVTVVNNTFYVVCDSSWNIFAVSSGLQQLSENNKIYTPEESRTEEEGESGYEAIFHDSEDSFHVVRESVEHPSKSDDPVLYRAIVEEIMLDPATLTYKIVRQCPSEKVFEGDSKGFEGAMHLHDASGELYMLALCEGNYCAEGDKGKERGHGRLVISHKQIEEDGTCVWRTLKELHIPDTAYFRDYSAITLHTAESKVAIASQEESQIWIGDISLGPDNTIDLDTTKLSGGEVYDFPRDNECNVIYCNIEGLHWLNHNVMIAVSDKMKSKGRQDFRCLQKDQSIHAFVLPETSW